MTQSKIQQQVAILLEKINAGGMTVQQLQNAYANTENHAEVTDEQREDLIEAITSQMRKDYPAVANKKFGPVIRDSRQQLEAYLEGPCLRFDLSENGHKTKVKVGGDIIKGETLINDYISYRNQATKVMCHLFFVQKNHYLVADIAASSFLSIQRCHMRCLWRRVVYYVIRAICLRTLSGMRVTYLA